MKLFIYLSDCLIPFLILAVLLYGLKKRINLYDSFILGAKNGVQTVFQILPTLIGLMVAVGILRASGFLDLCSQFAEHFTGLIGFPGALVPLTLVKMFSASAATGLLLDIYKQFGPDSINGLIASIAMSSTETIFYTMSIYFMTANVHKTKYTLSGALLASIAGITASVFLANLM